MGASTSSVSAASLTRPIDIAFKDPMLLPLGTTLEFHVTSDTQGLEPWNGEFYSPIISGGFNTNSPLHLIGNGSVATTSSLPAQYEWASFTPNWSDSTNSGRFVVRVIINAPGCDQLDLSRGFQMRKITTASENRVLITQTSQAVAFSSKNNNRIQLEIWSLSGEQIYRSVPERRVVLLRGTGNHQLANGVYLYWVREFSTSGELVSHQVKKLVLIR